MAQDHQLTFDWILYVILMPPVVMALWQLMTTWKSSAADRKTIDEMYARGEARSAEGTPDQVSARGPRAR